ncbi:hypothetical protein DID73_00060 [Candidatus Marinamargulisbacteria bacterium SCGC AG-343-K17]|nr:hypothetical protein DID73_00060 [Candidatus Marinamargulisbacteria bacterium SCGC AG-343-K17]
MKPKLLNQIQSINPINLSLLLTVFFIVTHFESVIKSSPMIYTPILMLGSAGVLFEQCRKSKYFWLLTSIFYAIFILFNWQTVDNHMYLWGYWLIAITMSFYSIDKETSLKLSAKYLIAFCMGYAGIQKLNPNFLSGDFFYFKLITDPRFNFIGSLIQFNLPEVISENKYLIQKVMQESKTSLLNAGPYILHPISKILTWYTIIIETIVTLVFFLPRKRFYIWQHWLLLLFGSLYFVLPIRGFAFTLLTMGFILIKKEDIKLKVIYLLFLAYIFILSTTVLKALLKATYQIS